MITEKIQHTSLVTTDRRSYNNIGMFFPRDHPQTACSPPDVMFYLQTLCSYTSRHCSTFIHNILSPENMFYFYHHIVPPDIMVYPDMFYPREYILPQTAFPTPDSMFYPRQHVLPQTACSTQTACSIPDICSTPVSMLYPYIMFC